VSITAPLGVTVADEQLESDLRLGLDAVEQQLRAAVKSDMPLATEASRHLVDAGGKRFRPLLALLAAQLGDPNAPGVIPAAVVVELTHLATLYHDDVMDEAELRRGAESANLRYGNSIAILTGDFLFARASQLLADIGVEAVRLQARTFERLVIGQIRETSGPGPDDDPVEHHLAVVADKTGSLISTSARLGAMTAGVDEPVLDVLSRFGERFGVAFQLSDDLLDVTGDPRVFGKVLGTDLREGVPTLPLLYVRRRADPADARLLELTAGPVHDDADAAEALALLQAHPAVDDARAEVRRWVDEARESLRALPEGPAKDGLLALCDVVADRTT
jgi:heptaprenyl diphosphate synthase